MQAFTKTKDWPNRKYHATCWRKHLEYMVVDHEERAEIFMKVEAASLRILKEKYSLSWKYMVHETLTGRRIEHS